MKLKVDTRALQKQIANLRQGFEKAVEKGLQDAAEQGAQIARTQHSYQSHGGSGLESKTVAYKNSALDQGIKADTHYASWVEFGNGPAGSKIYPKKSSVLHFTIDGKEVFVKWVKASTPKPFMINALNFEKATADRIVGDHINTFLKSL